MKQLGITDSEETHSAYCSSTDSICGSIYKLIYIWNLLIGQAHIQIYNSFGYLETHIEIISCVCIVYNLAVKITQRSHLLNLKVNTDSK